MRRLLTVSALAVVTVVASGLPALAAEADESSLTGDAQGALVALLIGVVFGAFLVIQAYRDPRFGGEDAHHEDAHDVREGFAGHTAEAPEPGVEEMGSGDLP